MFCPFGTLGRPLIHVHSASTHTDRKTLAKFVGSETTHVKQLKPSPTSRRYFHSTADMESISTVGCVEKEHVRRIRALF